jgi:ribosomal protein S11
MDHFADANREKQTQTSIGIPSFNATRRNQYPHLAEIATERIREAQARRRVRDVKIPHFLTVAHAFAERDGTS